MDKNYITYLITNLVNGKYYVGQTGWSIQDRWGKNLNYLVDGDQLINRAARKYGLVKFKIEIISFSCNQAELDSSEEFLIWLLGSRRETLGYNIQLGGRGGGLAPESIAKMAASLRVRMKNPTKKQLDYWESLKGKIPKQNLDPNLGSKISSAKLGVPQSESHRLANSRCRLGKPFVGSGTPEFNNKISLGKKGKPCVVTPARLTYWASMRGVSRKGTGIGGSDGTNTSIAA